MLININESTSSNTRFTLFNLGFRPFFLIAGLYAVISMLLWLLIYANLIDHSWAIISNYQWHSHEMIYGYSVAVIAGFLLAAVKNWTGVQTLHGKWLAGLVMLWLLARIFIFFDFILFASIFDLLFLLGLSVAVAFPIIKTKQWNQIAIVSMLVVLLITNTLFYLGALGLFKLGINLGIYAGLLSVVGLILKMSRRVVPFFIEKGLGEPVTLFQSRIIDISSAFLFIGFFIFYLLQYDNQLLSLISIALFALNAIRLMGWHHPKLWSIPMLWVLYLALWFICFGFLATALTNILNFSPYIAIHAFAYGGIGMITLGMMSRVTLGHTGRNVQSPPASFKYAFIILGLGSLLRIVLPIALPALYFHTIIITQIMWIIAFLIFTMTVFPMLKAPRLDNQFG